MVSGVLGRRVFEDIIQEIKLKGLEMRKKLANFLVSYILRYLKYYPVH